MLIIDPLKGKVRRVKYDGDFSSVRKAIGCEMVDVIRVDDGIDMFVDDEGMYKNPCLTNVMATHLRVRDWLRNPESYDWSQAPYYAPVFGVAVVLGVDYEGSTVELNDAQNQLVLEILGQDQTMPCENKKEEQV